MHATHVPLCACGAGFARIDQAFAKAGASKWIRLADAANRADISATDILTLQRDHAEQRRTSGKDDSENDPLHWAARLCSASGAVNRELGGARRSGRTLVTSQGAAPRLARALLQVAAQARSYRCLCGGQLHLLR